MRQGVVVGARILRERAAVLVLAGGEGRHVAGRQAGSRQNGVALAVQGSICVGERREKVEHLAGGVVHQANFAGAEYVSEVAASMGTWLPLPSRIRR